MSEEEIIDIAERIANFGWSDYDNLEENKKAIQGLLDLYNKEKEKNKLLKTYKGNLPENVKLICLCKDDFERNISTDYISKDKIREKIKELENEIEIKSLYEENWNKIEVLKELLEENKSNENNI